MVRWWHEAVVAAMQTTVQVLSAAAAVRIDATCTASSASSSSAWASPADPTLSPPPCAIAVCAMSTAVFAMCSASCVRAAVCCLTLLSPPSQGCLTLPSLHRRRAASLSPLSTVAVLCVHSVWARTTGCGGRRPLSCHIDQLRHLRPLAISSSRSRWLSASQPVGELTCSSSWAPEVATARSASALIASSRDSSRPNRPHCPSTRCSTAAAARPSPSSRTAVAP